MLFDKKLEHISKLLQDLEYPKISDNYGESDGKLLEEKARDSVELAQVKARAV